MPNIKIKQPKEKFVADVCSCCLMSLNYSKTLAKGGALALIGIYNRVRQTGVNDVHTSQIVARSNDFMGGTDEMLSKGYITKSMDNNISMLRFHGMVAKVPGKRGHWLVTSKGAAFLRGGEAWKCIIRSKKDGRNTGPYVSAGKTTLRDLLKKNQPMWDYPENDSQWIDVEDVYDVSDEKIFA